MSLSPGARLGPYEIVASIGAGGMGQVYRARDTRLNRVVALKVLPPESANTDRRRRFLQEAQAASILNHPNIVTIHDIVSDAGRDAIAMEHIAGRTLEQVIPADGLPTWRRASSRDRDRFRRGGGARRRRRSSRPQAGQRHGHRCGAHQSPRLRPGKAA